jgi:hypothetical protein
MPVDFRSIPITIPNGTGGKTPTAVVTFGSVVRRADTALKAITFDFASADHHINVVEATTGVRAINGNTVTVAVNVRYADKNFDDNYSGLAQIMVIAEVA